LPSISNFSSCFGNVVNFSTLLVAAQNKIFFSIYYVLTIKTLTIIWLWHTYNYLRRFFRAWDLCTKLSFNFIWINPLHFRSDLLPCSVFTAYTNNTSSVSVWDMFWKEETFTFAF